MTTQQFAAFMEQLTDLAKVINNPGSADATAALQRMEKREKDDPDVRTVARTVQP